MKLNVVHDRDGRIQAAAIVPETDDMLVVRPLPSKDQAAAEIEVAEEHRSLDLETLCKSFRIDTTGDRPKLVESTKGR
jgi:hypothetical protein